MVKQTSHIVDTSGQFIANVLLTEPNSDAERKSKTKQEEQFQVAGFGEEDVPMTANMLRLLPQAETMSLDNIESRVTSVSLKDKKMAGASLTTVLT